MKRRQALNLAGLAALAAVAQPAAAQHEHHASHGASSTKPAGAAHPALLAASSDCVVKGQLCLAHCLRLLAGGDKSVADCAVQVSQLLALCGALQDLAAQGAPLAIKTAKLALEACTTCAEACKPHVDHHAECKACYLSCLECAKACRAA
jgi:Cys-rich four helix bundle protein (predicted Tat secretion target)